MNPAMQQEEPEEEKKSRRQGCNNHCARCDMHFSGLTAFDAHRAEGECTEEPLTLMTSGKNPHPRLQVWTEDGYCRLQKGAMRDGRPAVGLEHGYHPVTIYQAYTPEGYVAFGGTRDSAQLVLC